MRVFLDNKKEDIQPNWETPIRLSNKNLRCIEQIYGEYGLHVIDALRLNPRKALPLILHRLEQKERKCRQRLASLKIVSD